MKTGNIIKLSVLDLISFTLQSGDLGGGFASSSRMADAIKAHQEIQKSYGEGYLPEVAVSYAVKSNGIDVEVTGRIDGIIKSGDSVTIDEIKTTCEGIENIHEGYNQLHFAQAKCYAYIYSELNGLVDMYVGWAALIRDWTEERDTTIKDMEFPFPSYRKGQRELAVSVYKAIRGESSLFVHAPTGTGKTIASLFPAVKALVEGFVSQIFYLTAKTTTRTVAEKALCMMRGRGLRLKALTLTAKEKICLNRGAQCNSEE